MASPKSTLPNSREEQDSAYNPGDLRYSEENFNAGNLAEQAEAYANDPKNHNEGVRDAEESGDESLKGGFYRPSPEGKRQKFDIKGLAKKQGPLAALISLVFGAGLGFSALFSPSLLIIHMKEIMVDRFNTQIGVLDARSTKLLNAKINQSTSGTCGQRITIRCKFSTMSEKQVTNFRNAGIEVEPSEPNAINKRTKPTAYIFKGERISATDFSRLSRADPEFRTALRQAYNPKFAGFQGKAWAAVSGILGISKAPTTISGQTDQERMASLNENTRNGEGGTRTPYTAADFKADDCDEDCQTNRAEEANAKAADLEEDAKSGEAAKRASSLLSGSPIDAVSGAVKVTGVVDGYCQAYGALNALGYAAKTIRAIQLARYAMAFMKVADEIKAGGEIAPETVAFMGGILTEVTYDVSSTTRRIIKGSATDSLGFKFAAYGDTTASPTSMSIASRYLAGGGLTGELIEFTNAVTSYFPNGRQGARDTCGVLANPVVQAGSIIGGVALLLVPGVNVGKAIAGVATSVVLQVGLAVLPSLLSDIVAGTVTEGIVGEESGNAIASGACKIMCDSLPGQNGNALMDKQSAIELAALNDRVLATYAEDERNSLSPLDVTSRYTFLGSIVSTLLPSIDSFSRGGSGVLSSISSTLGLSLGSIIPKSNALTAEQYTASLNVCQDLDALEAGYATDIFCNVIRGIPPKYLDRDPLAVIDDLVTNGYLTSTTQTPTQEYRDFIAQCITGTEPPGYSGAGDFNPDEAKECIIDDDNANLYLHYVDQRVEGVMSGDDLLPDNNESKMELVEKILAKGNVNYLSGYDSQPKLEDIAAGTVNPDAAPCGVNIYVLRMIDAITDEHSITISSLNRQCNQDVPEGSSTASRHYAGNGSAIDISNIDGRATTGRDANALSVIEIIMPILAEAAEAGGGSSGIGQSQCGSGVTLSSGVRQFEDFCHHLHIDVPPTSDPNLEHS